MRLLLHKWDDTGSTYYAIPLRRTPDDSQNMCVVFVADIANDEKIRKVGSWLVFINPIRPPEYYDIELSKAQQHKAIRLIFTA